MTLPWIIAAAAAGLVAGPRIRASVFARSTEDSRPRRACPECSGQVLAGRWLWCSLLPVTGRCPHCKARIGPAVLAAELVTGLVLAVAAARASSGWELAALAWLALIAVPLAFIDAAVHRLPDPLTISAFTGALLLLAGAAGAAHQPWLLVRAVIGAAVLAGFYLALWLIWPDQLGLGDVKLAASIGLVLGWGSWGRLVAGALAGALLGAVYARVLLARRGPGKQVYLPLGPFLLLGAFAAIALLLPGPDTHHQHGGGDRVVRDPEESVGGLLLSRWGFDAVVIGEPQRAFYGNQYSLTMPVLTHYGVELWVPEVGGPIDPDSEAHDLIMSVFGGMSKGERNRIKLRVRAAMAAQAAVEGRFLGGRPPYGYRIADAGPHAHPAKAADGKRLHKLEPDPETAWVVRRIFADYLAGRGLFAIAEGLTRDRIPSPSQYDAARNPHRTGQGWAKAAVRAILRNPRYTGRQVWNKQRKDEILLDVNDVARGYETRLRWNDTSQWVWSEILAQEPLVTVDDFEAAQAIGASASRRRKGSRETREQVRHPYVLRGRLYCGYCGRKMQGQYSNHDAYYRCRYPKEYGSPRVSWRL